MDSGSKSLVCTEVYRQFPEVKGASPKITNLPGDKYQLVFRGKVKTEDGKTLPRTVRVVADETGRIVKLSTSR